MKATMTISLPKDLKENFTYFAKSLWTNPTNLLCMIMKNTITTREVKFINPIFDIEIEPFSDEEIKSFSKNFLEKTEKNAKKMEKLLAKV